MKKLLFAFYVLSAQYLSAQIPLPISNWLASSNGHISARINQYNKEQYNLLINQNKFPLGGAKQQQVFQQSKWEVSTLANFVLDKPDAVEYNVTFKCTSGHVDVASVSVDIDFDKWSEKNYVLLPSAAYNGNRYEWRRLRYSPKLYEVQDIGIDKPIILTDVPKLNGNGAVSRIQERSGDMAVPSIGFISDTAKTGIWLLTKQGNSLGDYGMDIAESRNREKATLSITSPIVREQYLYKQNDAHYPSWDMPKDFKTGDEVTITFRLYGFKAPVTTAIFDKYAAIRKDFSGTNLLANALPYSACMGVLEQKFNEKNFVPQYGYYSVGFRENFLQDWQIGWTGGMISTYPLLFAGNKQTQENVLRNFDWLFPNGISPSGFYYDAGRKGTEWLGGDIRKPHTKNWHLIRKSGDAVWYITKQFMLMDKMGIPVKQSWSDGNKKVCDVFVKLWDKYHQIGQFVDSQTGDIVVGGSSSGGIVPAALALASAYYQEPKYLQTAMAIADYYNTNFIQKGISCGGPGDAVQNFDSESIAGLLESYVSLYEVSGDGKWLPIAEDAAKQLATWVVGYNYHFPDTSAYGRASIHSAGTVYANTQNKHASPGLCTASGVGLLKLFRYTGNPFYLDLLQDIAHNITQYLPHPKKPLGNATNGYVSERINLGDWEGVENIGYVLPLSTWAETSLMLTTIEVPGIYIQKDKGLVVAFDNVATNIVKDTKEELVVSVTNTTPLDASISIMEETSKAAKQVMGENKVRDLKRIQLKPGETTTIILKK
ncbi:hypothetical protein [Parasediminibacterium sp. JCM 36343]|uniref:hypothetical protein n=1 Tax=Parasediminibacterium sp. JCM 36343 TaxID=3374279 RepID=UPI00397A8E67